MLMGAALDFALVSLDVSFVISMKYNLLTVNKCFFCIGDRVFEIIVKL